jgi:hypothetical protein
MFALSPVRPTPVLAAATAVTAPVGQKALTAFAIDDLQLGSVSRMMAGATLPQDLRRLTFDVAGAGYTGITLATGHAERLAGGRTPWIGRSFSLVNAVAGVIDLNSEMRSTVKRPTWAKDLVLAGGYMATTGSVIGVLGGLLPGACVAAVGAVIQAVGLAGYALAKHAQ